MWLTPFCSRVSCRKIAKKLNYKYITDIVANNLMNDLNDQNSVISENQSRIYREVDNNMVLVMKNTESNCKMQTRNGYQQKSHFSYP